MATSIYILSILLSFTSALPWFGPKETICATSTANWSPAPTKATHELFKRDDSTAYPANMCGWQGPAHQPVYCSQSSSCAWFTDYKVVGCCSIGGFCDAVFTSCIDWSDEPRSVSLPGVYTCQKTSDVCYWNNYGDEYSQVGCGNGRVGQSVVTSWTGQNQGQTIQHVETGGVLDGQLPVTLTSSSSSAAKTNSLSTSGPSSLASTSTRVLSTPRTGQVSLSSSVAGASVPSAQDNNSAKTDKPANTDRPVTTTANSDQSAAPTRSTTTSSAAEGGFLTSSNSTSTSQSGTSSGTLPTGAKIGIAVTGIIIAIIGTGILAFWFVRRRNNDGNTATGNSGNLPLGGGDDWGNQGSGVGELESVPRTAYQENSSRPSEMYQSYSAHEKVLQPQPVAAPGFKSAGMDDRVNNNYSPAPSYQPSMQTLQSPASTDTTRFSEFSTHSSTMSSAPIITPLQGIHELPPSKFDGYGTTTPDTVAEMGCTDRDDGILALHTASQSGTDTHISRRELE